MKLSNPKPLLDLYRGVSQFHGTTVLNEFHLQTGVSERDQNRNTSRGLCVSEADNGDFIYGRVSYDKNDNTDNEDYYSLDGDGNFSQYKPKEFFKKYPEYDSSSHWQDKSAFTPIEVNKF